MRILVYALVLANLGLLAWTAWFAPRPPEPTRFDGPGLTLLREFTPAERPAEPPPAGAPATSALQRLAGAAAETPVEPDAEVAVRCVNVGPFIEPDVAESALAALADAGIDARAISTEQEIRGGFWVYVEQLADMDAARATLAQLEEQGIEDAYIIQNSDSGILISLGVYSDLERASTLAGRVGGFGFDATVADRIRAAEVVRLEFDLADTDTAMLDLLRDLAGDALEQNDCAAEL